jgi:hypothetical protein
MFLCFHLPFQCQNPVLETVICHPSLCVVVTFARQIMQFFKYQGILYFMIANGFSLSVPFEFAHNSPVIQSGKKLLSQAM